MTTNEEKINRNLAKIADWDGSMIADITDYVDVIRANGGEYSYAGNEKVITIPEDIRYSDAINGIYAVDTDGNVLYVDGTVDTLDNVRKRKEREEKGLASLDKFSNKLQVMIDNYQSWIETETERVEKKNGVRSTKLARYNEAITILEDMKKSFNLIVEEFENK